MAILDFENLKKRALMRWTSSKGISFSPIRGQALSIIGSLRAARPLCCAA